jgi:hypothetical protein
VDAKTNCGKGGKDSLDVTNVVLSGVYDDVVLVGACVVVMVGIMQNLAHDPLDDSNGIPASKWHNLPLPELVTPPEF